MNLTDLTAEVLAAQRPDLVKAIEDQASSGAAAAGDAQLATARAEGRESGLVEGRKAGAEAERARLAGIDGLTVKGMETLAAECKSDGSTPEQFAVKQATAQKAQGSQYLAQLQGDEAAVAEAPPPAADPAPAAVPKGDASNGPQAFDEKVAGEAWDKDPKLRAEFSGDKSAYLAFAKAEAAGRVRRLKRG